MCRGVPGMNTLMSGAVRALCENAPHVHVPPFLAAGHVFCHFIVLVLIGHPILQGAGPCAFGCLHASTLSLFISTGQRPQDGEQGLEYIIGGGGAFILESPASTQSLCSANSSIGQSTGY